MKTQARARRTRLRITAPRALRTTRSPHACRISHARMRAYCGAARRASRATSTRNIAVLPRCNDLSPPPAAYRARGATTARARTRSASARATPSPLLPHTAAMLWRADFEDFTRASVLRFGSCFACHAACLFALAFIHSALYCGCLLYTHPTFLHLHTPLLLLQQLPHTLPTPLPTFTTTGYLCSTRGCTIMLPVHLPVTLLHTPRVWDILYCIFYHCWYTLPLSESCTFCLLCLRTFCTSVVHADAVSPLLLITLSSHVVGLFNGLIFACMDCTHTPHTRTTTTVSHTPHTTHTHMLGHTLHSGLTLVYKCSAYPVGFSACMEGHLSYLSCHA